jgi:hypothetical protein
MQKRFKLEIPDAPEVAKFLVPIATDIASNAEGPWLCLHCQKPDLRSKASRESLTKINTIFR